MLNQPWRIAPIFVYANSIGQVTPLIDYSCKVEEVAEIPSPEPVYDMSYDGSRQEVGTDSPTVKMVINRRLETVEQGGNSYREYRILSGNN